MQNIRMRGINTAAGMRSTCLVALMAIQQKGSISSCVGGAGFDDAFDVAGTELFRFLGKLLP